MPKRNENLKRLLNFCDENDIDITEVQAAQEEMRGHEMDARLKMYATIIAIASTLIVGAWRLFSTESIAQQAHLENQAQASRISAIETMVNGQQVTIAVQGSQFQTMTSQLNIIQSQQTEILKILNDQRIVKK